MWRPSCAVGRSPNYGACSHEAKQTANFPRQKLFVGMAEPSYKALFRVRKSRDDAVRAGNSKSLFRVGSGSCWWRLCRFDILIRPIVAPISCRVALLYTQSTKFRLFLFFISDYHKLSKPWGYFGKVTLKLVLESMFILFTCDNLFPFITQGIPFSWIMIKKLCIHYIYEPH